MNASLKFAERVVRRFAYLVLTAAAALAMGAAQGDERLEPGEPVEPPPLTFVHGDNVLRFRGLFHVDARHFLDESTSQPVWELRRARPIIEGTLHGIYDFRVTPNLASGASSIVNAMVSVRIKPWARISAGKLKMPVGLERLTSSADLRFMEHGFPTNLVPNNGVGVQLGGAIAEGTIEYALGYYDVQSDDGSDGGNRLASAFDGESDFVARVFVQPFVESGPEALRGFGIGIGGTYAHLTRNGARTFLPAYRTPGREKFFRYRAADASDALANQGTFADGERWRLAPQFHFHFRQLGLMGEYVKLSQDVTRVTPTSGTRSASLDHAAWQMQFAWLLTGEEQVVGGITPHSMFSLADRTWGAFELAARFHTLDIDDAAFEGGADSFANPQSSPSEARSWGLALNWYLNEHVRWSLNHDVTRFDGGANDDDRPRERTVSMRFGLQF